MHPSALSSNLVVFLTNKTVGIFILIINFKIAYRTAIDSFSFIPFVIYIMTKKKQSYKMLIITDRKEKHFCLLHGTYEEKKK